MLPLEIELEQNGITDWINPLIQHQSLLNELDYALRPVIHEGKIQPYGFVVLTPKSLANQPVKAHPLLELTEARQLADGCNSFVVFQEGDFRGVLPLSQSADDERKLVQLQQELDATICTTHTDGITKIFSQNGVLIHQLRRWQKKPSVKHTIRNICRYIPQMNAQQLQDILEFCFHELSPRKIGATLIWCLTDIPADELDNVAPKSAIHLVRHERSIKIGPALNNAILRHVLTYTDGATLLAQDGTILEVGVHLRVSSNSVQLLEACKGTRHTSAKRFSYDFPQTIAFVVSSDGPVTVFSDGVNIVNLKTQAADDYAPSNIISPAVQSALKAAAQSPTSDHYIVCSACQKKLRVHETGRKCSATYKVPCPVCRNSLSLALNNRVIVSVMKDYGTTCSS